MEQSTWAEGGFIKGPYRLFVIQMVKEDCCTKPTSGAGGTLF